MTSHASVNVMLALEDAFDIEFPESMLKKSTFESIAAIRAGDLVDAGRLTGAPTGPHGSRAGSSGWSAVRDGRHLRRSASSVRPGKPGLQATRQAVDEQAWLPCASNLWHDGTRPRCPGGNERYDQGIPVVSTRAGRRYDG